MEDRSISNSKVASSFLWVLIEKFGYSGINLLSTLVLARLLSPYEFGLVGAVTIIISISNMIVESGMGAALVNKKNVTREDFNTVFTFNLFVSVLLCAVIFLSAPFVANYFNSPILKDVVRVLSLTLIFNAFTLVQRTVLIKKLLLKKQSIISLSALIVSVVFAVWAAYSGWGVWAIVIQLVLYSAVYSVIIFFIIQYIPKLQFSLSSFKGLLGFGGRIILSSAIQVGYGDIVSSVIAKIYSIQVTGLYAQSQKLVSFPLYIFRSLFDSAAFPILSKTKSKSEFKAMCSQINRGIYLLAFPLLLVIPFNTKNIIQVVLGDHWLDASRIFAILSIGVIISLIEIAAFSTLKSAGEVKTYLSIGTSKAIVGISVLSVTFLFSIETLLCGIIFTNLLTGLIAIYYVDQLTLYKIKEQFKDIFIPFTIGLIANIIALASLKFFSFENVLINLLTYVIITLLFFIVQCLLFKVKELNFIIKNLKHKK